MIVVYMLPNFRDPTPLELSEGQAIRKQWTKYFLGLRNRAY